MKKNKEVFSIRIDPELIEAAQKAGLNLSQLMQKTLETLLKNKKCPVCGQKIKKGTTG